MLSQELEINVTEPGKRPFEEWVETLDHLNADRVRAYLARLRDGNFRNTKQIGAGLWELLLFFGSGYSVYFHIPKKGVIVVLSGGDKSKQSRDIVRAASLVEEYVKRIEKTGGPYRDWLIEGFRKDPESAAGYLNAAVELGDMSAFLIALKDVIDADIGMSALAELTELHRVSLYKMLSGKGNPTLKSLEAVLGAIGLELRVARKRRARKRAG